MADWYAEYGVELLTHARVADIEPGTVILADGRQLPAGRRGRGHRRPARHRLARRLRHRARPGRRNHRGRVSAHLAARCVRGRGLRLLPVRPLRRAAARAPLGQRPAGAAHGRRQCHRRRAGTGPRRSTTRCRTSGPSSSAALCSTRAITRPPTRWCGAAIRRAPPGRCCWLRDGALVALLAVGRARDLAQGRKLILSGAGWIRQRAADPSVPLKAAAGLGSGYRLSVRDGTLVL